MLEFPNEIRNKFNVGQLVLTWSLNEARLFSAPFGSLFRASGSTLAWKYVFQSDIYQSFKYICYICYPRSSKNARWADSPLKARVCSRLKPRMAWLFTFQSICVSVFHQTIHCLIVLEKRATSASGTDSKSDMNAALGASSVKAQIMS